MDYSCCTKGRATEFGILRCSNNWPSGVAGFLTSEMVGFYLAKHNIVSLDTNIATIMNILAAEDLNEKIGSLDINGFEIDKKIEFNDLQPVKDIIDEYKVYYHRLDEKYSEFDKRGANKSISIFRVLKAQYLKFSPKSKDSCDLFFAIINEVIEMVMNSKNYIAIPYEELEMCVNIIVVDAFVRCKIFENPEGYDHVVAR